MAQPLKAGAFMVFSTFLYHLRSYGLRVSMNEWLTLMNALQKGLAGSSLMGFYFLSRAVLVKSEAEFDRFDTAFAAYFDVLPAEPEVSEELLDYLSHPVEQQAYDKDEVDARTDLEYEALRRLLEQRLREQVGAHNGGSRWIGTGGTSPLGNSGYSLTGLRVGGGGARRSAVQVASARMYRDFREDETVSLRQFQTALRRLRQMSVRQDAEKTELDLEETIARTSKNGGHLRLAFRTPRKNAVKLLLLFDSGGSMEPHAKLCSQLFQAAHKSNHFAKLQTYYFHNCPYGRIYKTPACNYAESVDTQWLLTQLSSDYKVIFVGDASMSMWEIRYYISGRENRNGGQASGLVWLQKFVRRCAHAVWFNPIPSSLWDTAPGRETIARIRGEVPMFQLSVEGLEQGIRQLVVPR